MNQDEPPRSAVVQASSSLKWVVPGSILVSALVCFFFSPRFVLWRGLDIHGALFNPELNRAADTLKQVAQPFAHIDNATNVVINWRLLFPLLAHWLHLPRWLFLALPHIGCLIAVGTMIHVVWRRTGDRSTALMAAALLATSDWFFVSMGWLTYFDSWFVLGLVIATFIRSRLALGLACLLVPWIDERIILALPLCAVVREVFQRDWSDRRRGDLAKDFAVMAALALPYVGLRLALLLTKDTSSAGYLTENGELIRSTPLWRYAEGFWAGFRVGWVYLIAFCLSSWRQGRSLRSMVTIAVVLLVIAVALTIAGDISRSMAILLPAVMMGILVAPSWWPRYSRLALPIALAANLLLPAQHVIATFKVPIFYLYHELDSLRKPPPYLDPVALANEGVKLYQQGKLTEAKRALDSSIQLGPRLPEAYLCRAVVLIDSHDLDAARKDLDQAVALKPSWADAYYYRGVLALKVGPPEAAISDLRTALARSDSTWARRAECEALLTRLGANAEAGH